MIAPHAVTSVLGPPGPLVALGASLLLSGGALLAAVGERFFERADGGWTSGAIFLAPLAFIATMFLPWVHAAAPQRPGQPFMPSPVRDLAGWDLPVTPLLLILGTAAVIAATGIAVTFRWRAAYLACALGAWVTAAVAFVGVTLVGAHPHFQPAWGIYPAAATGAVFIGACLVASVGHPSERGNVTP